MVGNKLDLTKLFKMSSLSLEETCGLMFCMSILMSFHHLLFNIFANGLTLCYQLMAFTPLLMWSLPIPLGHIWFCVASSCGVIAQTYEGFYPDWHPIDAFLLLLLKLLVVYTNKWMIFFMDVLTWCGKQMMPKGPLLAILCAFYR
jgi:hypothetical protein